MLSSVEFITFSLFNLSSQVNCLFNLRHINEVFFFVYYFEDYYIINVNIMIFGSYFTLSFPFSCNF